MVLNSPITTLLYAAALVIIIVGADKDGINQNEIVQCIKCKENIIVLRKSPIIIFIICSSFEHQGAVIEDLGKVANESTESCKHFVQSSQRGKLWNIGQGLGKEISELNRLGKKMEKCPSSTMCFERSDGQPQIQFWKLNSWKWRQKVCGHEKDWDKQKAVKEMSSLIEYTCQK